MTLTVTLKTLIWLYQLVLFVLLVLLLLLLLREDTQQCSLQTKINKSPWDSQVTKCKSPFAIFESPIIFLI